MTVNLLRMAAALAAAAFVTGCAGTQTLGQPGNAAPAAQQAEPEYANPMRSSVSAEQRGRSGADATAACRSKPVSDFLQTLGAQPPVKTSVGYYTDAKGLSLWGAQLRGGEAVLNPGFEFADELHALCWFEGDFTVPGVDGAASRPADSIIVDYQRLPQERFNVVASSPNPIGVFAPPPPEGAQPAEVRAAARVAHGQPDGVQERPAAPSRRDELQRELESRPDYNAG